MRLLAIIHQTTTASSLSATSDKCVYWRLYIKPQLLVHLLGREFNASIGDYTSNHNSLTGLLLINGNASIGDYTSSHNLGFVNV